MDGFHRAAVLFYFLFLVFSVAVAVVENSLESDKNALVDLKSFLLSNNKVHLGKYRWWNENDVSPCGWAGITCAGGRVTGIDLSNSMPRGDVYPRFSSLTALSSLDLSGNTLGGQIPADLGRCASLRYLNLSANVLEGPLNITGLVNLETIDVTVNRLSGAIPASFPPNCGNLVNVNLSSNRFSGDILGYFDGCVKLQVLDLSSNSFMGLPWKGFARLQEFSISGNNISGELSAEIFSKECKLRVLDLSDNTIFGTIPVEIVRCQGLVFLNLWGNKLSGRIPAEIGQLQELEVLNLGNNSFDPGIPRSLVNCSNLTFLDLSRNGFVGDIPPTIGEFRQIQSLSLHGNNFTGGIASSGILKIPNIMHLDLSFNQFSGNLPLELTRVPTLKFLILTGNSFSGSIPPEFGNLTGLQALDVSYNRLTGSIPPEIGKLTSLLWLMLAENFLEGEIPPEIGNCSSLLWLNLANNKLSGKLPNEISRIGSKPEPIFAFNRRNLAGPVGSSECLVVKRWIPGNYPPFTFDYALLNQKNCLDYWNSLIKGDASFQICVNTSGNVSRKDIVSGYLQLTGNELSGEIPASLGQMKTLSLINLGFNRFTGKLPSEIGQIPLKVLNVTNNNISGPIPQELGNLRCLESLDLSYNNFSGEFPVSSLSLLSELSHFNVSFNPLLSGKVLATGQLGTFGDDSFLGDPLLFVDFRANSSGRSKTIHMPADRHGRRPPMSWKAKTAIASLTFPVLAMGLIICGILALILCHIAIPPDDPTTEMAVFRGKTAEDLGGSSSSSPMRDYANPVKIICLDKTVFTYADILMATENFSEQRIIGSGGFGTVYRGVLHDGKDVAVKKLRREGPEAEKEFRMEMDVLSGGGMGWCHPNLVVLYGWCLFGAEKLLVYEFIPGGTLEEAVANGRLGGWRNRVKTAKGVARALVYLHHECHPAVVHRDVKASNVLLDGEGRARVTDFGLARMVGPGDSHVSTLIAGSVGYVAPEYGQSWRATTRGDVYSYGVVVMEIVTGRTAIGGGDGDGDPCLVDWVRGLLAAPLGLKSAVDPALKQEADALERMVRVLHLALRCTDDTPAKRPDMREVLSKLVEIENGSTSASPSPTPAPSSPPFPCS
ncbi:putative LRR receptor-like serine/threonine-protein kinase [Nymphaea thermarum]|nr:putative LRR receptor-like serine/threonine-protein kinase [Nymphaea thermarum]